MKSRKLKQGEQIAARLIADSGLGDKGAEMTFENFEGDAGGAVDDVTVWVESVSKSFFKRLNLEKNGLFLFGETGVGKTHLACAATNVLLGKGIFCKKIRMIDIPRNDQEAVEVLADWKKTPVLFLDDFGAEKWTPRMLEIIYFLIEHRLWDCAPVIITSNFAPKALARQIDNASDGEGGRIVGRIREMGVMVPVIGENRRESL